MNDIDLARQLVAYVDATTTPTVHPENTTDAEIIMLDTRDTDDLDDSTSSTTSLARRWLAVAAGLLAIALIGGLVAITQSGDDAATNNTVEFELVGGEDVNDLSAMMGWGFADEPLADINSPGPTIDVMLGDEVTVTFTNRHGWSQDPDDPFFESVDQSFRVVTPGQVGDVKFGADTGLVAPGESATITFTADEVGEFRYLSTGLISDGMFGRFVVTDTDGDS